MTSAKTSSKSKSSSSSQKINSPKKSNTNQRNVKSSRRPNYQRMVTEALRELDSRKGSTRSKILNHIKNTYGVESGKSANSHLRSALEALLEESIITLAQGKFLIYVFHIIYSLSIGTGYSNAYYRITPKGRKQNKKRSSSSKNNQEESSSENENDDRSNKSSSRSQSRSRKQNQTNRQSQNRTGSKGRSKSSNKNQSPSRKTNKSSQNRSRSSSKSEKSDGRKYNKSPQKRNQSRSSSKTKSGGRQKSKSSNQNKSRQSTSRSPNKSKSSKKNQQQQQDDDDDNEELENEEQQSQQRGRSKGGRKRQGNDKNQESENKQKRSRSSKKKSSGKTNDDGKSSPTKKARSSTGGDSNKSVVIINGSLFDAQLFQPIRSSYIIDYGNTSQDLNRHLEGHNISSKCSTLDAHLFKLAFIITLSDGYVDNEVLVDYCPHNNTNVNILDEISHYKRFCFPELNSKRKSKGQFLNDKSTYVFTRTRSNGQVEYGYCRRLTTNSNQVTKFPIVFCIVSAYSYFKLYDAILNEITKVYLTNEFECNFLIQSFYSKPLPVPTLSSSGIICMLNDRRIFYYLCPRDNRLNHDYYSTLLSCLSPNHIVQLFESILCSKRILVFSRSPSKLTKCCLALSLLIYPFIWSFPLVSLMPSLWLHDLVDSPCPYIYGCLYETIQDIPSTVDHDAIHVDLDLNTIADPTDNIYLLPLNLRRTFESSLEYIIKYRFRKVNSNLINIAVSEACLNVFIELFYCLPDFFKQKNISTKKNDDQCSMCSNYFIESDSENDLESLVSVDLEQTTTTTNNEDKQDKNRFDYDFQSEEFLSAQPKSYVSFLKGFIHGMIFLKFLDDYQQNDGNNKEFFLLFTQRLKERRQMTSDDQSINPLIRFQQTFDLLAKQIDQVSKQANPSFSKYLKKIFEQK
ncbi:unnamed protein product [Rotaria sp. Silwood1]|nr:unnamed protein product [Rotaria sp. Silwood1]